MLLCKVAKEIKLISLCISFHFILVNFWKVNAFWEMVFHGATLTGKSMCNLLNV